MKENVTGDYMVSVTDPNSRRMKDKKGNDCFGYNFLALIDSKCEMIVSFYLTNNASDNTEIYKLVNSPNMKKFSETVQHYIFDNGFWSPTQLIRLIQEFKKIIIPNTRSTKKNKNTKNKNKFHKDNCTYDPEKDIWICPNGEELPLYKRYDKDGIPTKKYRCNTCHNCPDHKECTSSKYRTIKEHDSEEIDYVNELYESDEGQELYGMRACKIEGLFADIKASRNFAGIKHKGKNSDFNLLIACIVHNLKKLIKNIDLNMDFDIERFNKVLDKVFVDY